MVSFPPVSPQRPYTPPSLHPYAPHAQPISFFLILSPAQYWVTTTTTNNNNNSDNDLLSEDFESKRRQVRQTLLTSHRSERAASHTHALVIALQYPNYPYVACKTCSIWLLSFTLCNILNIQEIMSCSNPFFAICGETQRKNES